MIHEKVEKIFERVFGNGNTFTKVEIEEITGIELEEGKIFHKTHLAMQKVLEIPNNKRNHL